MTSTGSLRKPTLPSSRSKNPAEVDVEDLLTVAARMSMDPVAARAIVDDTLARAHSTAEDALESFAAQAPAIRAHLGMAPNQPTTMMYLHCATDKASIEQGRRYAGEQSWAARNHYAVWNAPSFEGVPGYEDYAKVFRQGADLSEDKATAAEDGHLIGTPEEIIEKIRRTQENQGATRP